MSFVNLWDTFLCLQDVYAAFLNDLLGDTKLIEKVGIYYFTQC